mgnify:FL=1
MTGIRTLTPQHFLLAVSDKVATVTLNRPERKNTLTFDSYTELRDLFRALRIYEGASEVHRIVIARALMDGMK